MKKFLSLALIFLLVACQGQRENFASFFTINDVNNIKHDLFLVDENGDKLVVPFYTPFLTQIQNNYFKDLNQADKENFTGDFLFDIQYCNALFDSGYRYMYQGKILNNLYMINQSYGSNERLEISKNLYDILTLGVNLTIASENRFNLTIGALSDLWQNERNSPNPQDPTEDEVSKALTCTANDKNIKEVVILEEESSKYYVTFKSLKGCNDQVRLSLGAIGKGYAIEYATNNAYKNYALPLLINGGMSSIKTTERYPYGNSKWSIQFINPLALIDFNGNHNMYEVELDLEGALNLSTSGDYNQFFINSEGKIRHHIIDPRSGMPIDTFHSVSVLSNNSTLADAVTTILMNTTSIDEANDVLSKLETSFNGQFIPFYMVEKDHKIQFYAHESLENEVHIVSGNDIIYDVESELVFF